MNLHVSANCSIILLRAPWASDVYKRQILDRFGLAGTDLVNQLHRELGKVTFLDEPQKLKVTEAMAECDFRMVEGGGESLQLDAMAARICSMLGN